MLPSYDGVVDLSECGHGCHPRRKLGLRVGVVPNRSRWSWRRGGLSRTLPQFRGSTDLFLEGLKSDSPTGGRVGRTGPVVRRVVFLHAIINESF